MESRERTDGFHSQRSLRNISVAAMQSSFVDEVVRKTHYILAHPVLLAQYGNCFRLLFTQDRAETKQVPVKEDGSSGATFTIGVNLDPN